MRTTVFEPWHPEGSIPAVFCEENAEHCVIYDMDDGTGRGFVPFKIEGQIACVLCIVQRANLQARVTMPVPMWWGIHCNHEGVL